MKGYFILKSHAIMLFNVMHMLDNSSCVVESFIISGCCNFFIELYLAVQLEI